MKKNFRQIISIMIAVFMITAMVPAYGFAETGTAAQPQTAVSTSDDLKYNVNGKTYTGWGAAMAAAEQSSKKIVTLTSSGTLPAGEYVVPEGVTLLIPFDENGTLYKTEPECLLYYWSQPTAYRTLTMSPGAKITVNGALSVSAPHTPVMGYLENGGSPYSAYGHINMKENSSITVNHGGELYAYGYITGDGTVQAKNGSVVYEYFQVMDFRGGRATTHLLTAKYEDENGTNRPYEIFPFSQYYVQNIEVPLTLEYGAREYGYTSVYAAGTVTSARIGMIGPNNDTMFKMHDGYVTKEYDGSTDRLNVTVSGSADLDSIVIKGGDYTIDSADYVMPVGSNMTIKAASGTLNIAEDFALIPGAEMLIDDDAVCKLDAGSSLYVYDSAQWGKFVNINGESFLDVNYAPGRTYVRTAADLIDARIQIAGELDATNGYIYTTADGAEICALEGGQVRLQQGAKDYTWQFEYVGPQDVDKDYGNYHKIPVTALNLKTADGSYVQLPGAYKFENGTWNEICYHDLIQYEGREATCTAAGWDAYETCSKCDYTTYNETPATGHKYAAEKYQTPTASVDGGWYQICDACGDKQWNKIQTWNEYVKASTEATTVTVKAAINQQTETVNLTWSKAGSVKITGYKVYRSQSGNEGSFELLKEVTGTKYTDNTAVAGTTYYYYVVGYRTEGEDVYFTGDSSKVSAKVKKITAAQVKETKMSATTEYAGNAVKVNWTAPNIKVDGYQIWRSTKLNGTYKLMKNADSTARTWTNKGLKLQSCYYYKVRGYKMVNGSKVYTKFSAKSCRFVLNAQNAKLANAIENANAITSPKAVKKNGAIKVTWSKKTAIKCTKYEVWRATSKNGKYTKIATTGNKYYNDKSKSLKKGKRYYYKIVGYRWFGKACPKTKPSSIVSCVK